jgi:membrane associated rhomboid family serine protease
MLEDRDYMRQPAYHEPRISFTVVLLIINAIIFLVECLICGYPPVFSKNNYFALSVDGIEHGYVWQFLTFQFMHAGLLHIFFNSWAIYVFGRQIEMELGPKKFLALYFSSGVIGGVFQVLGGLISPGHFGTAVVGASAGAMGLISAFAILYPDQPLIVFFYFFPIKTRAKYVVLAITLLSVLCIIFPQSLFTIVLGNNVSNAAHLGGILTGFVFARWILYRSRTHLEFPSPRSEPREFAAARKGKNKFWSPTSGTDEDFSTDEFLQKEVDPILDKISAHGIQSLTAYEHKVLEKARQKMAKR